jgi:predicted transposase YdaD
MMTLSKDLEREFQQELKQYEGEKKMPYITSIERAGQLEGELIGEQRGELKGEQKVILRLLNQRVGEIQPPLIEQIRKLSVEQLEELTDVLLTFSTVADLEQWLQRKLKTVE